MTERPQSLARPEDVVTALALMTRLPVRARFERGAAAAWAWPVAGAVVGAFAALAGYIGLALGLPPLLIAILMVGVQVVLTGALHEDGIADVADGFWGGHDRDRRLEIMKDSRVGSYGVLALVFSVLARVAGVTYLVGDAPLFSVMVGVAMLSRAPMAILMAAMPNARGEGLSASVGRPSQATATLGVALAIVAAFVLLGWTALAPIFWSALAVIALAAVARTKIGGQTGDVLGASQQVAEIAALAALATMLR